MHYYIDGYNLLFRVLHAGDDLPSQRQRMIEELNTKFQLLNLNATLVFDSQYQIGSSTRSHYQCLEILFSSHGETADERILDEIRVDLFPRQAVVVTSDKKLAWFARRCSVKTESVEQFMEWVNKRYKNKLHQRPTPAKQQASTALPKPKPPSAPVPKATPEENFDYYLDQFQKQLNLEASVGKTPLKNVTNNTQKPKKKGKSKIKSPCGNPLLESDTERWQRLFERNLEDPKNGD